MKKKNKTVKDYFYDYLESEIEELYDGLKDEIKDKFILLSVKDGELRSGASCEYMTLPPTIRIFINSLEIGYRQELKRSLKELLTHEIIHAIQGRNTEDQRGRMEEEAYQKQNKINFWK
ncbi:MAG: hypothetical protein WC223_13075 [Bacteroidales bacterium]|jgi:hypothetical protein